MPEYRVSKYDVGLLLEDFLARKIPSAPSSYLRQLIKTGKVKSASNQLNTAHRVALTDIIQLPESNRLLSFLADAEKAPSIIYESREVLIADKPSGLAIHRSKGHETDNLTDRINYKSDHNFKISPVHRLDLETSGPVLFGKGKKSCSELGKLLMKDGMRKIYIALVKGQIFENGLLKTEIPAKGKMKEATTGYKIIAANEPATLLEIELFTGRQHQIRRQLAAIGHPLFGDKRYQGPCPKELPRLFLHCRHLAFKDPFATGTIDIESPLPETLTIFLRHIGLDYQEK